MAEKIQLTDSIQDVVVKMAQGNPGAVRVCAELLTSGENGIMHVLDLDDMNLRGPSIWLAYKDFAGQDLTKLIKALRDRDPALVAIVNQNGGNAVRYGGSR